VRQTQSTPKRVRRQSAGRVRPHTEVARLEARARLVSTKTVFNRHSGGIKNSHETAVLHQPGRLINTRRPDAVGKRRVAGGDRAPSRTVPDPQRHDHSQHARRVDPGVPPLHGL